jgi:hypothetical protein
VYELVHPLVLLVSWTFVFQYCMRVPLPEGEVTQNYTMFLFCGFLLRILGKQPWWLTVVLTLLGSFGTAYLFRQLQVILPGGILGI